MGLAARGDDAVAGHGDAAGLQPFLQRGLGILAEVAGADGDVAMVSPSSRRTTASAAS